MITAWSRWRAGIIAAYYALMSYQLREGPGGVELVPPRVATASVIWLHGLGASGHDFVPIVPHLGLPESASVRFVFPHAPVRAVTLNQGFRMRAWYDIHQLSAGATEDGAGIGESAVHIESLIRQEQSQGIAADRIVLAGFSQGGAVALHVGTRLDTQLAGILALSTYLPLRDRLPLEDNPRNHVVPILMCHGRADPVLGIQIGRLSRDALVHQGYSVQWMEYDMAHEVCDAEIADIARWLKERLP
jgi:phospholipase/carboxylesterase